LKILLKNNPLLNDKEIIRKLNGNTRSSESNEEKRGTMKEQKWDENLESTKDFLDPTGGLPGEEREIRETVPKAKSHLTELRRRIEERLDTKRIDLDYELVELDDTAENLQ
tara:strand:+ start:305 stop:637 length:333 start_codon:yes stop_codon:yes gene_type:complete